MMAAASRSAPSPVLKNNNIIHYLGPIVLFATLASFGNANPIIPKRITHSKTSFLQPQQLPFTISSSLCAAISIRGGSVDEEEDDEEEDDEDEYDDEVEEEEDDDDDDDELFEGYEMDDDDGDFEELNYVDRTILEYKNGPPLTKAYWSASFVATALGYVINNNKYPGFLTLEWKLILKRAQIWRLFTGFFNFGSFGIGYIATVHFAWTYMSTLERLHHHQPYDYWIMFAFGMICMLIGYPILKLSPRFLGHNLTTYLVYVWSRYHEGGEVSVMGLFTLRAEVLPWFFLAQTFLLEGEPPILDFLGIVFGHIYYHLKCVGMLRAPKFFVAWYKSSDLPQVKAIRDKYEKISSDFHV